AEVLFAILRPRAAAERLDQVGNLLVAGELVGAGAGNVEDLAAQRQHRLARAVARLLGRAACRVTLNDEEFRALRSRLSAVCQLAWQAQLAHCGLAADFLFLTALQALVRAGN